MNGFVYGPRRHNNREALSMGKGSSRSSPPQKFTFHMDGVAALTFSFFPWKRTKSSKNDTMILDHGH